jgi:hypothetical protein
MIFKGSLKRMTTFDWPSNGISIVYVVYCTYTPKDRGGGKLESLTPT